MDQSPTVNVHSQSALVIESSQEKKPRSRSTILRSVIYSIICAGLGSLLAYASGGGLLTITTSFVISGILGAALAIIQGYEQRVLELEESNGKIVSSIQTHLTDQKREITNLLEEYRTEMTSLNDEATDNEREIVRLIEEFDNLVQNAATNLKFYSTLRALLDSSYSQRELIHDFIEYSMRRPIFTQPMREKDFYDIAAKGTEECKESWQAVHQGPISSLRLLTHFSYLHQLKDTDKPIKKQRIVILDEAERKELDDYDTVDRFLKDTEGTEAYWIAKSDFYKEFDLPSSMNLDDAALHDGKLLILRLRETQLAMLALKGQGDRGYDAIVAAFDRLNLDIQSKRIGAMFKIIQRPTQ